MPCITDILIETLVSVKGNKTSVYFPVGRERFCLFVCFSVSEVFRAEEGVNFAWLLHRFMGNIY